jgi:hypothetical protein
LEAATQRAKQKIMDNSIQAPRITNNKVVILNSLPSSQRAAWKNCAILGKFEGPLTYQKTQVSQSATRHRPIHGLTGLLSVCSTANFSLVFVVAFPNAIQCVRKAKGSDGVSWQNGRARPAR